MVKVGKCALMQKKWTLRFELTKKTSHCKSRDFLRKRRLKMRYIIEELCWLAQPISLTEGPYLLKNVLPKFDRDIQNET